MDRFAETRGVASERYYCAFCDWYIQVPGYVTNGQWEPSSEDDLDCPMCGGEMEEA